MIAGAEEVLSHGWREPLRWSALDPTFLSPSLSAWVLSHSNNLHHSPAKLLPSTGKSTARLNFASSPVHHLKL